MVASFVLLFDHAQIVGGKRSIRKRCDNFTSEWRRRPPREGGVSGDVVLPPFFRGADDLDQHQ
jgi:hypothetical protein